MSTTGYLVLGGALLAIVVIVVVLEQQPVSAADQAIKSGSGLLSQVGSWWSANYEF